MCALLGARVSHLSRSLCIFCSRYLLGCLCNVSCAKVAIRIKGGMRIRKAHVWLLGDIVEGGGDIFPGQAFEISAGLNAQISAAADAISDFVRAIRDVVGKVHVTGVVGNHGRNGRRGQQVCIL